MSTTEQTYIMVKYVSTVSLILEPPRQYQQHPVPRAATSTFPFEHCHDYRRSQRNAKLTYKA